MNDAHDAHTSTNRTSWRETWKNKTYLVNVCPTWRGTQRLQRTGGQRAGWKIVGENAKDFVVTGIPYRFECMKNTSSQHDPLRVFERNDVNHVLRLLTRLIFCCDDCLTVIDLKKGSGLMLQGSFARELGFLLCTVGRFEIQCWTEHFSDVFVTVVKDQGEYRFESTSRDG